MGSQPLVRVNAATAAEVCARFKVKKEALAHLREGMDPGEFVEALVAKKQYLDGIDFMVHALPPREAIWWGCLCLQHAYGDNLSPADKSTCRAVVQWIMQPTEQNRVAALVSAQTADPASPATGLVMAVCQTGGSVAPANAPAAAPTPFAPAKAVAGAVKLVCTKAVPTKIVETQRLFLELAIWLARAGSGATQARSERVLRAG